MKIGIDISQIVYQGTGVGRFTQGLVSAILEYDNKNQWLFVFSSFRKNLDKKIEKNIIRKGHKLVKWKIPPTVSSFLFNNFHQLSKLFTFNLKFLNSLDWFITSDWSELPLKVNKATIVHDLVYLRYPQTVDKKIRETQEKRLFWVKKESKIIFADSQATKEDLINYLKIDPNRIIVNYPGVLISNATELKLSQTLKKFNLKKGGFILTVGKLEPRKNLERLIKAWRKLNKPIIDLIIVGPSGWGKSTNIKYQIPTCQQAWSNIKYLGYINDQELYSLYASCLFFIYPSIWEGFGYPVLEAMKLDAPVACSNTSSIKEVVGDAALLFNPYNINEITKSIAQLTANENLRKRLIEKGKKRSKIFSWKNYYQKMIQALNKNV